MAFSNIVVCPLCKRSFIAEEFKTHDCSQNVTA